LPLLAASDKSSNGYLVIGDRALKWARQFDRDGSVRGYTHVTDLALRWHQYCGLPFVFARWVVHREAPQELTNRLTDWLARFKRQEDRLIERSIAKVAERLDLPADYVARYLKIIRRCLTAEDDAGQERFLKELGRHGNQVLFKKEA
jgi:predicted solute-binding protein